IRILGHECAGQVAVVGKTVTSVKVGDRVVIMPVMPCDKCDFCRSGEYSLCENFLRMGTRINGCFAEHVRVFPENLLKLPVGVDHETACILEPSAVALHSVKRAGISAGDVVCVFGCGSIGLLIMQWARLLGARRIFAVDIFKEKLDLARKIGIIDRIKANDRNPVEEILELTKYRGADLVFEAVGSGKTIEQSIEVVRKLGKIVIVGLVNSDVNLSSETVCSIVRKELTIYGSYDADIKPLPLNSWETSLHFLETKRLNLASIITHRYKIDVIDKVFHEIANNKEEFGKVIFVF
ncbi:zinc-binding dehydrogenase, partial [Candidatus Aerophobetes bacterium]|nr:zinc-binding dehydrogenase [Candidatus Aerophobetes bacterium]